MVSVEWENKNTKVNKVSLPFQTVEKLTEKRILKQRRLDNWIEGVEWPDNYDKNWKNRLIWGDNKYVMSSLLKQGFKSELDLIYVDPPFATGADFSMPIKVGDKVDTTKEPSVIEEIAYRDTWGDGLSSYLQMMYERLTLMKELLADEGSIFVHLDWRVAHYVKGILDEIFGKDRFNNEIIWGYSGGGIPKDALPRKHDVIFWYTKSDEWTYNPVYREYSEGTKERGRTGVKGKYAEEGLRDEGTPIEDWWTDVKKITSPTDPEKMYFPTQKSEDLLQRIIHLASNEGDLVADFFSGSGTTAAAAEKMGRRWIASDLSKFAIHVLRKRMLDIHNYSGSYNETCRPFVIQNLGSYQKYKFIENGNPPTEEYREFLLELYNAEPIGGYHFVHGRRGDSFVHLSGVDSVITTDEVEDAIQECTNALGGSKIDILGWDFELGLDKTVNDLEQMYGVEVNLRYIPKEATELNNPSSDRKDIKFFDRNYLEVETSTDGNNVHVELSEFILANPEFLEEDLRESISSFTDWIDYWAVDFDYRDDIFHNMWQSYRTPHKRELSKKAKHSYDSEGPKNVFVKVIDVFGNDTNKLVEINT